MLGHPPSPRRSRSAIPPRTPGAGPPVPGPDPFELLEPRRYCSFVYEPFTPLTDLNNPRPLASGYFGPLAPIADVDSDGVRDLLSGRFVLSGRTGALLRTHVDPDDDGLVPTFGFSVADIGDADGDGVSDYAIGNAYSPHRARAFLYSGATGQTLFTVADDAFVSGAAVSRAGDIDDDGHADLLVGIHNSGIIYSGADHHVLLTVPGAGLPGVFNLGIAAQGGPDLDGDGVPDFILASTSTSADVPPVNSQHLWAFSGADGSLLWDRAGLTNASTPYQVLFSILPDLTADGVPDVAQVQGSDILIYSGADGSLARTFTPRAGFTLEGSPAALNDLTGDSVPELAVTVTDDNPGNPASFRGGIYIVSGADGALVTTLHDTTPAPNSPLPGFRLTPAAADLDGDGHDDIVATIIRPQSLGIPPFARTVLFDGQHLLPARAAGITTGGTSRSIVWGSIGPNAFLILDGRTTVLTNLASFNPGEVIIDVAESTSDITVLASAPDGTGPFLWIADAGFTNIRRVALDTLPTVGGPAGAYSDLRAVAATTNPPPFVHLPAVGHLALVQRTLDGPTGGAPTAWLADLEAGTLTYLFTGTPVDVAVIAQFDPPQVVAVGIDADRPGVGLLWRNATVTDLPGVPVALSDGGYAALGTRPGAGGAPDDIVIMGIDGPPPLVVLPRIEGGEAFVPVGITGYGAVAGTYTVTATGQRSAFYYTPSVNSPGTGTIVDIRASQPSGNPPAAFATTPITLLAGPTGIFDLLVQSGTGGASTTGLVSFSEGPFPFRAADNAPIALGISPQGDPYYITANEEGDVVPGFTFTPPHYGPIVTWTQPSSNSAGPSTIIVALARPEGLLLVFQEIVGHSANWVTRNITAEIPGAQPITSAMVIMQMPGGLYLIGGLNAGGELVLYGQTAGFTPAGRESWAFDNLYQSVVYPGNIAPPDFSGSGGSGDGQLTAYVTSWGGLNIAGAAAGGQVVVFWTAPGLGGWQVSNLSVLSDGDPDNRTNFRGVRAELTPWNGINLYGESNLGNRIQVLWWVPQFGDRWRADLVVPDSPLTYQRDTLTAFAQPWGGLNLARLDSEGHVEILWWSPATSVWARERLNDSLPAGTPDLRALGRLASIITPQNQTNIYARNAIGDIFRFFWSPDQDWALERV